MARYANEHVSSSTPRMGNPVTRAIGDVVLWITGWRLRGQLPDEKKVIIIGAPHTSNWDLIIAMAAMLSVGLCFFWIMKKEAFVWPLGSLWKALGGIPIDRSKKNNITEQMTQWFEANDNVWLGMTPEGTRSKVERYKKGYLRIAYAANVPVFIVAINAKDKEIVLDKIWPLTGDIDKDNNDIKAYYDENYIGIRPKNG